MLSISSTTLEKAVPIIVISLISGTWDYLIKTAFSAQHQHSCLKRKGKKKKLNAHPGLLPGDGELDAVAEVEQLLLLATQLGEPRAPLVLLVPDKEIIVKSWMDNKAANGKKY